MNDYMMGKKLNEILKFVYSYLLKMGASKEDAEDIVQDTAYKFLQYIDSVTNTQSWLFRVAVNQYYDLTRKKSRRKEILLKFNIHELFEEDTPEIALLQSELVKDIHELLKRLKPKYRQLLLLKYSTGLKINEIAELYGMKEGSVKTILHRARKEFIEQYRRYDNEQRK
ncbi:RNA polymerase sigma factor [Peribacillus frigoritolerans]|uniref:RNA polymerase sigma factor n=2 Tax=Peribacillus TaxID=2675229 RepID=A0AA90PEK5_9BACI|nr:MULTISPECIES: RNA polymerase sigma factor [Peribacillus]QNK49973.1 RNA polymerase sigma factor [Brevibacterium sp. PAMC23299]AMM91677.1 RNA polymerase sigma-70 factor [Peribacillus simplex]MDF1996636.1 RNA polymerase sigma factor [Peribacillus frigoritolerans]MDM5292974.1 RNA polymerase sigma factor [Peribacillus simplex]MDP1420637.1 RNA polymerase sigma factor [Peribacillus simplex]